MPMARPNFLFFLPDQMRHDWLGCAGREPVRTPHLDALSALGTRFLNAYTPCPLCAPARACLARGREYAHCGVPDNHHVLPLDQPTYYARLRESGYHVMGCGKFDLHKGSPVWGEDGQAFLAEWGFSAGTDNAGKWDAVASGAAQACDPYMAHLHARGLATMHAADMEARRGTLSTSVTPLPDESYCDNWIGANAVQLLEAAPRHAPWHLVVNFTGPHEPFDVTEKMHGWYRQPEVCFSLAQGTAVGRAAERHQEICRNYAAMIENIDRLCGEILAAVAARGELDNTVVVFSSDHGEMLGEKGRMGKGVPCEAAIRIPLVWAGPDMVEGVESEALVSLIDISATFLDYAGAPALPQSESRSLRPVLEGRGTTHRSVISSALDGWRVVRDARWKLVTGWPPGEGHSPQLFDPIGDPGEEWDLSGAHPEIVARLQQQL